MSTILAFSTASLGWEIAIYNKAGCNVNVNPDQYVSIILRLYLVIIMLLSNILPVCDLGSVQQSGVLQTWNSHSPWARLRIVRSPSCVTLFSLKSVL